MNVIMPQIGETVAEGTIATWFKKPGDLVDEGEALFEIETDKVAMEVQALASGRLTDIRVAAGATAPVGAVVAVIGPADAVPAEKPARETTPALPVNGVAAAITLDPYREVRTPPHVKQPRSARGVKITPLARRLIAELKVDTDTLAAEVALSGGRRIDRRRVLDAVERRAAVPVPAGGKEVPLIAAVMPAEPPVSEASAVEGDHDIVPLNRLRRKSAETLARAWREVPHVTQGVEVNFQRVDRARRSANDRRRDGEGKLTFLPFIARAVCLAIRDFPQVNASLGEGALKVHRQVSLGIAVDLAHDGLVVPVIRNANDLTIPGLARAIDSAIVRARQSKLNADDLAGATYTISNSGSFGTLFTTPIVNPPQVAILSSDGIAKRPMVVEDADGDRLAIGLVGILAQSFDHRAFDGAYSAAFLRRLRDIIEMRDWAAET